MSDPRFTSKSSQSSDEDWMTTFADMMTLLLAFFVLLVSVSTIDAVKYEKIKAGMAEGIGKREASSPISELKKEIDDIIRKTQARNVVAVSTDTQGVILELASGSFYEPASAAFRQNSLPILETLAETVKEPRYVGFQIEVQGHTDDTPISTPEFPSNWELSAGRATRVVRYFEERGIEPFRMRATGMADTAPKVPNRDPFGEAIPANQDINRRIVVRIYPRSSGG